MTRRNFIASSAATALAYSQVPGSNERLRIGVIGCGGQANDHMRTLVKMRDSDNCDIITSPTCSISARSKPRNSPAAKVVKDYRRMLG